VNDLTKDVHPFTHEQDIALNALRDALRLAISGSRPTDRLAMPT
jgi:hypothetical protein